MNVFLRVNNKIIDITKVFSAEYKQWGIEEQKVVGNQSALQIKSEGAATERYWDDEADYVWKAIKARSYTLPSASKESWQKEAEADHEEWKDEQKTREAQRP